MKLILALSLTLIMTSVFAQQNQRLSNGKWAYYGEEFYTSLASQKKIEKLVFLHVFNGTHTSNLGKLDVISENCSKPGTCYQHVSVGYDRARRIMFGELDTLRDNNGTYVLDVYCGKKFYFRSIDDVSNMHTKVNIEHTWPQSLFSRRFQTDMQKSDMHHLFLTDSHANSVRGNNPFGLIGKFDDRSGSNGCENSRHGLIDDRDVYTPPVSHRGNVARALFYFSMHYNLEIDQTQENILRQWHRADPIDDNEVKRHEAIAKHQKVRNPFVDHPEIVEKVLNF